MDNEEIKKEETGNTEPPRTNTSSMLAAIFAKTKEDAENEYKRFLEEQKKAEQLKIEEDKQAQAKLAADKRKKAEEIRRQYEMQLREYEQKKLQKETQAQAPQAPQQVVPQPQQEKKSMTWLYVAISIVGLGGVLLAILLLLPKGEPVVFTVAKAPEKSEAKDFTTEPVPFGPASLKIEGNVWPPSKVVAEIKPMKYEPEPPKPKVVVAPKPKPKKGPVIKIDTTLFGGKKIVR